MAVFDFFPSACSYLTQRLLLGQPRLTRGQLRTFRHAKRPAIATLLFCHNQSCKSPGWGRGRDFNATEMDLGGAISTYNGNVGGRQFNQTCVRTGNIVTCN